MTRVAPGPNGESWSERLTALDAMFLDLEEGGVPMHVGSVSVFSGPPPSQGDLAALVSSKLPRVPRYGQKLLPVPFSLGRPLWVDDPDLDLGRHVLATKLEGRGGVAELRRLAARLFARKMDRRYPLWEYWIVTGVSRGRFAVISKTHHCMIDGISGVDLASILMETEPGDREPPAAPPRTVRPGPGLVERATEALGEMVAGPVGLALDALRPESEGRQALEEIAGGALPLVQLGAMGPAPASSLNAPVGPGRVWETVSLRLADVKRVRAALGGTVNDVVLAVIAGALRRLFESRGEETPSPLRVMVPVSVRAPEERGTLGNRVAAIFCPLPVDEPDPGARLRKVSESMKGLKESRQAVGAMALTRLGDFAPPTLAALAARIQTRSPWFNLVVTNVPGPQFPLYLLGRRLLSCHPVVPLTTTTTVSLALLSYDGSIDVGLLGDAEKAADLAVLARAIPRELAALAALAGRTGRRGRG